MKIAFFGTGAFGIPALRKIHSIFGIDIVFTGVAKPARRGQKLQNTPIYTEAQALGIKNIHVPEKLLREHINLLHAIDYAIVVSYGVILPSFILQSVKQKCFNIHPSKLPLFRGAAPIERTLESGANETEICIIEMTKDIDAGNIIVKQRYQILPEDNSMILHEKFAIIGADLVVNLLQSGAEGITSIIQDSSQVTYAKKISKDELDLSNSQSILSTNIINKIRAFASCGYCYIFHDGRRIKIINAQICDYRRTQYDIPCLDGFVSPTVIRHEGRGNIDN